MRLCIRELCVRKALLRGEGETHVREDVRGELPRSPYEEDVLKKRSHESRAS